MVKLNTKNTLTYNTQEKTSKNIIKLGVEAHGIVGPVLLQKDTQKRLCQEAEGINPITGIATVDSLEC